MIDTHTHLYDEAFAADFQETLDRAVSAGVEHFIFPGIDSASHDAMMRTAALAPGLISTATGLHPTSVGAGWKKELDFVEARLAEGGWCAVGEIGLDRHWSDEFFEQQKEAFRIQMLWAAQASLPVIIHVRDAHDTLFETLDSLRDEGVPMKGVMHAFSGSIETYRRIKKYGGFRIGIGGVLTYKNAGLAETVKHIPLEDIVLETDSPWLTPVPCRGKRNESSYIRHTAARLADIKGTTIEEVDRVTTAGAKELFNLK
ncbi:MAG TPA: TatD family hydrolase [Candidatus Coprenecus stercoravium]|uniref:TatD family hydrolase n=1 Tax=Candidatus Coprenecus stercoravium TaxID=2840735 RepID=A0A9D2KA13_9BACT|nr:TatD family hydrolase [Candidatus Coprenecus stercoravium]